MADAEEPNVEEQLQSNDDKADNNDNVDNVDAVNNVDKIESVDNNNKEIDAKENDNNIDEDAKQEMATALTNLITTFQNEAIEQDELLASLQNDMSNNSNFGDKKRAKEWTVNEVCHWLTTIGLQDYIYIFYSKSIDGNILLIDINENILIDELGVSSVHCSKMLREIQSLKVCIV